MAPSITNNTTNFVSAQTLLEMSETRTNCRCSKCLRDRRLSCILSLHLHDHEQPLTWDVQAKCPRNPHPLCSSLAIYARTVRRFSAPLSLQCCLEIVGANLVLSQVQDHHEDMAISSSRFAKEGFLPRPHNSIKLLTKMKALITPCAHYERCKRERLVYKKLLQEESSHNFTP